MDPIILRSLVKLALFSVPAIVALLLLGRRGVKSKMNYVVSWANVVTALLWTVALVSGTVSPAILFVFCPFVLGIVSICMCVWPAEAGARRFLVLANGLMLVFWAFTIVAPN